MPPPLARMYSVSSSALAEQRNDSLAVRMDNYFFNFRVSQQINMPKYIIEREIPQAGNFDIEQLKSISKKSREVLCTLGTDIQWIHSYIAGDKIYCIYMAKNEEILLEHAKLGGFPANRITEVANIIDPQWGE
jgi:hypothetical protein